MRRKAAISTENCHVIRRSDGYFLSPRGRSKFGHKLGRWVCRKCDALRFTDRNAAERSLPRLEERWPNLSFVVVACRLPPVRRGRTAVGDVGEFKVSHRVPSGRTRAYGIQG